jgi:predicted nuclease of restriction endonuclease-like RecB superfamily
VLTADLVRARRKGDELVLVGLDDRARERASAIAEALLVEARAHVGRTRGELEEALAAVDVEARDERLKAGLAKLLDDRCEFESGDAEAAAGLRSALFLKASATRRALRPEEHFDRNAVIAAFAAERGVEASAVERELYADLRDAHVLRSVEPMCPESLVLAWEHGQAQAVLLRAVRVTVDVKCTSAGATRALFHRLKFLRLLHVITKEADGYRVIIDGPFSLFESGTKYGLQLAMVLPVLEGCGEWSLVANVRWGAERAPLVFRLAGGTEPGEHSSRVALGDDVAAFVASFKRLNTDWRVSPATEVLELPGVGLCVPDLAFKRGATKVYFEVMGYWSRDAVWRRVELVEAGLAAPILFAVSSRLRVSEEVLGDDAPSALYVYKGTMSARAVAERLDRLSTRAAGSQSA